MSQENVEIVLGQYAATNERDFERVMSQYADDVELVAREPHLQTGRFRGREAVGRWFGDWLSTFDRDARFDVKEARELPTGAVLIVADHHARGRASGAEVQMTVVWAATASAKERSPGSKGFLPGRKPSKPPGFRSRNIAFELGSRRAWVTHRRTASQHRAGASRSPLHDRALGRVPRPVDAPRPDPDGPLAAGDRPRSARPGRARARPRLRLRGDRRRRPGRGDRAARPLARARAQPAAATAVRSGGAAGRGARIAAPSPPPPSCARGGAPAHEAPRRGGRPPPLRRLERVLRPVPGRDDDLQLRAVRAGDRDPGGRPARQARADLPQARAGARPAHARHRLRLGKPGDPRRARARRLGLGNHALGAAGGAGEGAGARGRAWATGSSSG